MDDKKPLVLLAGLHIAMLAFRCIQHLEMNF